MALARGVETAFILKIKLPQARGSYKAFFCKTTVPNRGVETAFLLNKNCPKQRFGNSISLQKNCSKQRFGNSTSLQKNRPKQKFGNNIFFKKTISSRGLETALLFKKLVPNRSVETAFLLRVRHCRYIHGTSCPMGVALSYLCGNRNSSACRIERQKLEVRLLPGPFVLLFYILDCNLLDVNLCLLVAASKNIGGGKTASWVAKHERLCFSLSKGGQGK